MLGHIAEEPRGGALLDTHSTTSPDATSLQVHDKGGHKMAIQGEEHLLFPFVAVFNVDTEEASKLALVRGNGNIRGCRMCYTPTCEFKKPISHVDLPVRSIADLIAVHKEASALRTSGRASEIEKLTRTLGFAKPPTEGRTSALPMLHKKLGFDYQGLPPETLHQTDKGVFGEWIMGKSDGSNKKVTPCVHGVQPHGAGLELKVVVACGAQLLWELAHQRQREEGDGKATMRLFEERFKLIPQFPGLKHFGNGVCHKYTTG